MSASTLPPARDDDRATDPDLPPPGCRETWLPEPPAGMAVWSDDEETDA